MQTVNKPLEPIVVDLDGTLIHTDLLYKSACMYIVKNPFRILNLCKWLCRGVEILKKNLAERVRLDVKKLPYNESLLTYLKTEFHHGRRIVLATASHSIYAHEIATYLGIFSHVFATDDSVNLKGRRKLQCLLDNFGEKCFIYIGDSSADLAIFPHAKTAILVNPRLINAARKTSMVECKFSKS